MPNNVAIIILAAGGSSRLGSPKQLLLYKNTTLLAHAVEIAAATGCENVAVVTGADNELIVEQINASKARIIRNNDWQSGMASSIKAGINSLKDDAGIQGALIMLCDQPLISTAHLNKLLNIFSEDGNTKIIASGYEAIAGVPAVFPQSLFHNLMNLNGDEGAKQLIKIHKNEVKTVPFENAFLDVDTETDYQKLINTLTDHNN